MPRSSRGAHALVAALALLGGRSVPVRAEDTGIEYWTDYAIYPLRCINYNDKDQVMYAMFEQSANHCTDTPLGTYVAGAADFAAAYLEQTADNAADAGQDDWAYPAAGDYLDCAYARVDGADRYVRMGCHADGGQQLAAAVFYDAACTERDAAADASALGADLSVPFQKCTPCVHWMDKNDDEIDDQYYEQKQTNAPLCSAMWTARSACTGKCLVLGRDGGGREGWNRADKVLLSILSLFGCGMLLAIVKKRQKMSNKDALLEQAALSAAGLQPSHVLGVLALLLLVVVMFALLDLKKSTWGLLLLLNVVLFGYLMKLTVDGSVKETVLVDGKIVEKEDSDDDEEEDGPLSPAGAAGGAGAYEHPRVSPALPKIA